jgi:hypothetical protein
MQKSARDVKADESGRPGHENRVVSHCRRLGLQRRIL